MAAARTPTKKGDRSNVLRAVTTPLGFYVLALLIGEAILAIVLTCSKLTEEHVWSGFVCMLGIFVGELLIITGLTIFAPKKLLYGKEEHQEPSFELSALKDQVDDLIAASNQPKILKSPEA